MRHTVTVEDVVAYAVRERWDVFASSVGGASRKTLEVSGRAWFRVKDHDDITYHGVNARDAVEAYNAAP